MLAGIDPALTAVAEKDRNEASMFESLAAEIPEGGAALLAQRAAVAGGCCQRLSRLRRPMETGCNGVLEAMCPR